MAGGIDKWDFRCPVCGKHSFKEYDSYDMCPVCGWVDDAYQVYCPDDTGYNPMSLEEARESYKATGDSYAFWCDRNGFPRDKEFAGKQETTPQ